MTVLRTASTDQTRALGQRLGQVVQPGDVITLVGPFGAGKTTLVQGLGAGLGITAPIVSPSFAIAHEYRPHDSGARLPLVHMDLYRLADPLDVADVGLEEYLTGKNVLVVEWPEAAETLLPEDRLELRLEPDEDRRIVEASAGGSRSRRLLAVLRVDLG